MLDKIIKQIDKIVFFFAFVALSASLYYTYSLNYQYKERDAIQTLDNALLLTKNLLQEEQRHALSLSLLISQNKEFLDAYYNNDRAKAFEIIDQKIKTLQSLQGDNFEVQVHDIDSKTYLRSWDYNITNIPLSSFREGVVKVRKSKQPLVSVEIGRRLNIKAISPIMKKEKFMGSIEVIKGFGHLREKLLEHGYVMFILLNKKFIPIVKSLRNHLDVNKDFVLVNNIYEKNSLNALQNSNLSSLGNYGYFSKDNFSFGYFEIKNLNNKKIGYFMIALKNKKSIYLENHYTKSFKNETDSGVIIR